MQTGEKTKDKTALYLCGPITGTTDYEERFQDAQDKLELAGYTVLNPIKLNLDPDPKNWSSAMKAAIALMFKADGIATLTDWHVSRGAYLEVSLASYIGMPVWDVNRWAERGGRD